MLARPCSSQGSQSGDLRTSIIGCHVAFSGLECHQIPCVRFWEGEGTRTGDSDEEGTPESPGLGHDMYMCVVCV